MFTYAVIKADGTNIVHTSEDAPDYDTLSKTVGGWIEGVALEGVTAYCNEEGKLMGLPRNEVATSLAHRDEAIYPNDFIVGDMIVLGPLDDEGESVSLSDEWINININNKGEANA
jgi:hypothetical protein